MNYREGEPEDRFVVFWPVVSDDDDAQRRYVAMRERGESHSIAEMLALRRFPGTIGTDAAFMAGRKLGGGQFDGLKRRVGDHHIKKALDAGVNPAGKYYLGSLAREPGDPEAWVSGPGDVRRVCERRGWGCDGQVKVKKPAYADRWEEPAGYRVAADIVDREVADRIAADPGLRSKRAELTEEVTALRSGRNYRG